MVLRYVNKITVRQLFQCYRDLNKAVSIGGVEPTSPSVSMNMTEGMLRFRRENTCVKARRVSVPPQFACML